MPGLHADAHAHAAPNRYAHSHRNNGGHSDESTKRYTDTYGDIATDGDLHTYTGDHHAEEPAADFHSDACQVFLGG